jgi:ADP-dependent NAD(P)H-hydrate dehydratase / NAD(P)H-hydrate epimerase
LVLILSDSTKRGGRYMQLVTAEQMSAIDRRTIESMPGTASGTVLMERAGLAVVDEIVSRSGSVAGDRIVVLCGRGNNGGDGFVIARLLNELKAQVEVFLFSERDRIAGEAKEAMEKWEAGGGITTVVLDEESVPDRTCSWADADLIVDALLGTGLHGEVGGLLRILIDRVNDLSVPIVAVDIPSGISGSSGRVCGTAIRATLTVSFGLPKIGHAFYPGKTHCGTLCVADIGFPSDIVEAEAGSLFMTSQDDARAWMPKREPDAHKGDVGRVFVLAGSVGLTGAAAMTAETACRSGAGLVYLGCPESLNDILETKLTEAMTIPLPEVGKKRCLSLRAHGRVRQLAEGADVVAVGPGIGRHHETIELIRRFVSQYQSAPLVIDADALFALAGADVFPLSTPAVLTPHYGEFARLCDVEIEEVEADPLAMCRDRASEWGATILLKGAPTIVCGPSGETWVNPTGSAGMATGGSGDVLTGVIAAMIGQGVEPEVAARLGAHLHGTAGDLAQDTHGMHGMIAGDILMNVPSAIKALVRPDAGAQNYVQPPTRGVI